MLVIMLVGLQMVTDELVATFVQDMQAKIMLVHHYGASEHASVRKEV